MGNRNVWPGRPRLRSCQSAGRPEPREFDYPPSPLHLRRAGQDGGVQQSTVVPLSEEQPPSEERAATL